MYNAALLDIHAACPGMQIVVTAGNHDSASRLVVNNALWEHFNVSVVGIVARNSDPDRTPDFDRNIIEIRDKEGNTTGFVAAVPHCYDSNFPSVQGSSKGRDRAFDYFQALLDRVVEKNTTNLPVVLMAHLAISGSNFSGHDHIGGMDTRDISVLGTGYDYVALGHIHTPQDISPRIRYCGTPIPVNFGERFEHSVSIVTVEHDKEPVVTTRPIKNLIPLHDVPSEAASFEDVLEKLRNYNESERCYLRPVVKDEGMINPLAMTLFEDVLKDKNCRLCPMLRVKEEAKQPRETASPKILTGGELKIKTPLEIAEMFFKLKHIELTEAQRDIINKATIKAEQIKKGDNNEA